jgi:uncharacterized protein YukE
MSQAVVNPDDLESFVRNLKQFNSQLEQNVNALQGQFARLGETWRDQEHAKFAQEFEQTMRTLHTFTRVSNAHIPILQRKIQAIRDYLGRR